jgi:hypothetical protein
MPMQKKCTYANKMYSTLMKQNVHTVSHAAKKYSVYSRDRQNFTALYRADAHAYATSRGARSDALQTFGWWCKNTKETN